ncbi:MAG: hypothetical protein QXU98_07420 [Candidatus Parvarchaeota archaeon]
MKNNIENRRSDLTSLEGLEEYVHTCKKTIDKIVELVAANKSDPTEKEWMVIGIIADKAIEPFFYWRNETYSNKDSIGRNELDISEISKKYDLDLSAYPSRIGLKRMIVRDEWIQLLNVLRTKGYNYESSSRSFVQSSKINL